MLRGIGSLVIFGATDASGFTKMLSAALNIADYLCVGVIMFAGACWMFGNRTAAIEYLIGTSFGYLIIRHATDIRDFLKTL